MNWKNIFNVIAKLAWYHKKKKKKSQTNVHVSFADRISTDLVQKNMRGKEINIIRK